MRVHEKADLNNKDVLRCFANAWKSSLWFSPQWFPAYSGGIRKPEWQLNVSEYFSVPKIRYTYPIENDVFMLSFPMEKIKKIFSEKFKDWKEGCIKHAVGLIEKNGKLNNVQISDGRLMINGHKFTYSNYPIALLMMKSKEAAQALRSVCEYQVLDVEWKSLKEPAKLLVERPYFGFGEKTIMFVSKRTGLLYVPNKIDSIRKAEMFFSSSPTPN